MTAAVASRTSQFAGTAPYAATPAALTSQLAGVVVVYSGAQAYAARTSQVDGLAPYAATPIACTSQLAGVVVYGTGVPANYVNRAWTFTLDGHTFYVLQLGSQGTWVYDATTQEWAEWETAGYGFWNMIVGCTWGYRTVAGSAASPDVWELQPSALLDEGFRDINHAVTGILDVRSRKYYAVDAVRVTASAGLLDEVNGATFTFTYSDDQGVTWSSGYIVSLTESNSTQEIAWRSMGSFAAPGRVFQFSDVGGLVRIDGADVAIDNFDEDDAPQTGQQQGQQ